MTAPAEIVNAPSEPAMRLARVWLGPERPATVLDAIRRAGAIETGIGEANVIIWANIRDPFSRMQELLHPGIEWVQVDSAGIDHWIESGLIDGTRTWTSASGRYGAAVAEHVVALLLGCSRHFVEQQRAQQWMRVESDWLIGKNIGFLGGGSIVRESIKRLSPFGVRSLALCEPRVEVPGALRTYGSDGLHELLRVSDHVVVALPLTPATRGMVGRAELELIGPHGLLVNVGRGPIVDTDALVAVLEDGRLGGAGLDVTDPEPLPADHPLWRMDNVLITSHSANSLSMMHAAFAELVAENLARFRRGDEPLGVIDPAVGF